MRLGESRGWSEWVQKILPPLGFETWTVQPTASFYTDYTTPAAIISKLIHRFTKSFNWNFYDGEINDILG